ncbi:hypothetical protein BXZ70DRAFT_1005119 [Cristinia sonorae]|uniref:Protein kinase domain-containing protein n=1 Tax=Cristinia sonorae TaxID=1940300 RepID=A0A8K0UU11_9AGAR|nr:hypothetical protein BXZ70DRAFT_1005119 [Cristinia sonorae]
MPHSYRAGFKERGEQWPRAPSPSELPLPPWPTPPPSNASPPPFYNASPLSPFDAALTTPPVLSAAQADLIRQQWDDRVASNLPVPRMVKDVWGFDPTQVVNKLADLGLPSSDKIFIPRHLLVEYANSVQTSIGQGHLDSVSAALSIFSHICARITENYKGYPMGSFRRVLNKCHGMWPEVAFGCGDGDTWQTIGAFVHIVKGRVEVSSSFADVFVNVGNVERDPLLAPVPTKYNDFIFPDGWRKRAMMPSDWRDPNLPLHFDLDMHSAPLDDDTLLPAKYLASMLTHSLRTHATGVVIKGTMVTLYYGDRFILAKSAPFDFVRQPALLILVVAALSNAHPTALGFVQELKLNRVANKMSLHGSTLTFNEALDADCNIGEPFVFEVRTKERTLFNSGEAVGRGTFVVPVVMRQHSDPSVVDGRPMVVKMSWSFPNTGCMPEIEAVRAVRKSFVKYEPRALRHVVELVASNTTNARHLGLPGAFMDDAVQYRSFNTIVMINYEPLENISSADDFVVVIVDAMKGHYWCYEYGAVLHQDISTKNIMFYFEGNKLYGVLTDFDLARPRIDVEEEAQRACEWDIQLGTSFAGTPEFLSIESCSPVNVPVHQFPHDLESFFWVAILHFATHDTVFHDYGSIPAWLPTNNPVDVAISKAKFIYNGDGMEYFKDSDPAYAELIKEWVGPLRRLFRGTAVKLVEDGLMEYNADGTIEEARGWTRATLRSLPPRGSEGMPTFEAFMRCIGVDPSDFVVGSHAGSSSDSSDSEYEM